MKNIASVLLALSFVLSLVSATNAVIQSPLPSEPDEDTRLEEIYDHESRMVMFLYSLKGDGNVDYVTGRKVPAPPTK